MNEPKWVKIHQVDFIHKGVIEIGGGSHGLRDAALLESALARPQNHFSYGETDIFKLAASYAEAISRNHAFVDGNKRTAFMVASDFLEQNGYELQAARGHDHVEMMEKLAQGLISQDVAADHFRDYSKSIERSQEEIGETGKDWDKTGAAKKEAAPPKDWSKKADRVAGANKPRRPGRDIDPER